MLIPTNTPVALSSNESARSPAFSSASQETSSSILCCGSMPCASRGEIPKNRRIELVDMADETAAFRDRLARSIRTRIVKSIGIPTGRRHGFNGILHPSQEASRTPRRFPRLQACGMPSPITATGSGAASCRVARRRSSSAASSASRLGESFWIRSRNELDDVSTGKPIPPNSVIDDFPW